MRLLLDECMPRRLKREFCRTRSIYRGRGRAQRPQEWSTPSHCLGSIRRAYYCRSETLPRKKLGDFEIGVMVMIAPSNRFEDLEPLIPRVIGALGVIKPGEAVEVGR